MKFRFFSIVLTLLVLFTLIVPRVTQASSEYESRLSDDVPKTMSTHVQTIMIEMMTAVSCFVAGADLIDPDAPCLDIDPQTRTIGLADQNQGIIGTLGGMIGMTYNLPVSGVDYTRNIASNFGIVKKAEAQQAEGGIGFDSLSPLMPIWLVFRNFVYMLFVIVFMLIGLGIIFRVNIDSRSVMTIQNAIPKAIVILLLVTFSYAIVGLLIDLMFLSIYFLYELFASMQGLNNIAHLDPNRLQGSTPFSAAGGLGGISSIAWNASRGLGNALETFLNEGMGRNVMMILGGILGIFGAFASGGALAIPILALGLFGGFGSGELVNYIGGFIIFLVIAMAIIWAMFRLWFQLIKAYVFILLDVALAPLWIGASLIPGSPLTVGGWFRHVLSYIMTFPIAFMMFLLAAAFMTYFGKNGSGVFAPPMIGDSFNPRHFAALIGMAIILMTPEVIKMSKDIFKSTTENKYQGAVGAAIGGGVGLARSATKPITSRAIAFDKDGHASGFINQRISNSIDRRLRDEEGNPRPNAPRFLKVIRPFFSKAGATPLSPINPTAARAYNARTNSSSSSSSGSTASTNNGSSTSGGNGSTSGGTTPPTTP